MDVTVLKCKVCSSILVVNNNDLWAIKKCPKCDGEVVNLDEEFDTIEVIGEGEDVK